MSSEEKEIIATLKAHGFSLERQRKHRIWKDAQGRTWTLGTTPSDAHAYKNNLSDLRNFLGLNGVRGVAGERRPKRKKSTRPSYRASISRVDAGLEKLSAQRQSLESMRFAFAPKIFCCYPVNKVPMYRSPVAVILSRIFA